MNKNWLASIGLLLATAPALSAQWTVAVPDEIHLVPGGMVVIGDFDRTGVLCATGPKAIFLPASDPMFKEKLTLALHAKATATEIRAVLEHPAELNCVEVLATGFVPVVSRYFWQLAE